MPAPPWVGRGWCDVEALANWAFGPQRADASPVSGLCEIEARAAGYDWQGFSADGLVAVERIAAVGCRIDRSGPGRDAVHPVAELVVAEAARLVDGDLLAHYARIGCRPGGWDAKPRYEPERWREGREGVEAIWLMCEMTRRAYCPVILWNGPDEIAERRETYSRWWRAMSALWLPLRCYALPFELKKLRAAAEPWLDRPAPI